MSSKRFVIGAAAVAIVAAGGYGLYTLGTHRGMGMANTAGRAGAPGPGAALQGGPQSIAEGEEATRRHITQGIKAGDVDPSTGRKVLYYHDPMVPGNKFDKPAKSPFMDMMLVPVYADGDSDQGTVTVSPRIQQNLGVRTAEVTEGSLSPQVSAVGSIAYNERDQAIVQARASGFVERLHVRATLDRVAKGQPLAELYVPDWIAAQEEFLSVRRMQGTELAVVVDAARQRMRQVGMNDEQIQLVETTGRTHPRITLTAPISGVVAELMARDGMTVMAGATLFRINGLSTVWANAEVPESQSALLRPGARVQARSPAVPGTNFEGKVQAILPEVNPATRTLKARMELANPGGRLVPGMFVSMQFMDMRAEKALLVPTEALIQTGKRSVVMLAEDNGRFQPVEVEVGIESGGQTEIKRGLQAGQRVVVSSQFLIDSEASLRGVEARLNDAPKAAARDKAQRHEGEAKVERVGSDALTLSHGPIPSIKWGPMTMDFKVPERGLPRNLQVGDRIAFEFYMDASGMPQLTGVTLVAPENQEREQVMIASLIRWSIANRFLVLLATLMLSAWGVYSVLKTPVDALPDLSDVQVIIRTTYPGQAPRIVENQVTYPLTTTMLSVPGAKTVRGYSFFGDSFVYVLFDDGTDMYWARSRVLEYLNQVQSRLPAAAKPSLGPDATGVGWIYQYSLVDRSGTHDAGQLRAIQDWFLKYELKTVPNVAEVASVGGMVRQYQILLDPDKLAAYGIAHTQVVDAVQKANQETGGSVLELGEAEYVVRASGYLQSLNDFKQVPLKTTDAGISVRLGDVARIQVGPEMRRGIGELDGEGEATGGIIVMRSGKNALETIAAVKEKLKSLQASLPKGVEIVPVYDRSGLIERAVDNLKNKLLEEFLVVALVCFVFLFHLRSAFVAIVSLPLGILAAFIVMYYQGVNANIMSLGGIAIAIGAMVDAAVVMIENAHKRIEHWKHAHPDATLNGEERWRVIGDSAAEVGPALFFSLLIITLSFIPVFTLEAQEGRLFSPLAFTKTYAMAAAAGLSVTLIPVLMGYLIRGRIPEEKANPLNRWLIAAYQPLLNAVLRVPKLTLAVAALLLAVSAWPLQHIGGEFMPRLDEGDLLYMPSALPGLSAGKAAELLQQTDRLIKTIPEVESVFGKAGRAETATDPAPLEMFETTIQFKPRDQWRAGMTTDKLVEELDRIVKVPGLANIWVPPIRNRIDMLATGIKSPVGVKVAGTDLNEIDRTTVEIERVLKDVPGVTSALAERLTGGRYVDVNIRRDAAARFGMNISDVQSVIASAVGGENIGETVEGLQRFPINVRYPREIRDSLEKLRNLPIVTERGARLVLSDVADIRITDGPPMLRSENARLSGWVYVDIRGRDLRSAVKDMQRVVNEQVKLPPGYSISWSGQFEFLERATAKLKVVVPFTLLIIFVLLYLTFKRFDEALLIMAALPFALVGGIWLLYFLGYNLSVAGAVGFIALAGVAAEFGVIMLLYLKHAWNDRIDQGKTSAADLLDAIREGAVLRVRPKAMTVAVILAGLFPIMWGEGTGSEVMQRIAAPMVGGMITAPLLSMFVIPAAYLLMRRPRAERKDSTVRAWSRRSKPA